VWWTVVSCAALSFAEHPRCDAGAAEGAGLGTRFLQALVRAQRLLLHPGRYGAHRDSSEPVEAIETNLSNELG